MALEIGVPKNDFYLWTRDRCTLLLSLCYPFSKAEAPRQSLQWSKRQPFMLVSLHIKDVLSGLSCKQQLLSTWKRVAISKKPFRLLKKRSETESVENGMPTGISYCKAEEEEGRKGGRTWAQGVLLAAWAISTQPARRMVVVLKLRFKEQVLQSSIMSMFYHTVKVAKEKDTKPSDQFFPWMKTEDFLLMFPSTRVLSYK